MIKNKNINEESVKAMKEFHEKQIKSNIKLHIIFLTLIIILNIGLLIFIFIYKSKISEIKSKTNNNSSSINKDSDFIKENRNSIDHKIINIIANGYLGKYHFSFIFEKSSEVDKVKNTLVEYYKEKKMILDRDKLNIVFRYHGIFDGDSFSILKQRIEYSYNTFIFIETPNKEKLGFYIEDTIIFDKKNRFSDKENNCFLMSFKKDGFFKCKGKGNKLELKKDEDGMIIIGDGDIIIKKNYFRNEKSGITNFPFKSFDISTINTNIFTESNGENEIRGIEIFSFDIAYNYDINA